MEQAAWHLLQHLPKKAPIWGLSEALYGPALIPPLIVWKTPALTWINDRAYCTTLLILHTGALVVNLRCGRSSLQERSSDTAHKLCARFLG